MCLYCLMDSTERVWVKLWGHCIQADRSTKTLPSRSLLVLVWGLKERHCRRRYIPLILVINGVDIFIEMVGDGISVLGVAENAASIIWSDIPFPQLCQSSVRLQKGIVSNK